MTPCGDAEIPFLIHCSGRYRWDVSGTNLDYIPYLNQLYMITQNGGLASLLMLFGFNNSFLLEEKIVKIFYRLFLNCIK
jgi:hypothetical protein